MEHYRHGHHHGRVRASHLTKLYSDVKKSAATSVALPTTAVSSALNRKYRIQKDRLIAWGLSWSDDEKGPDGNIDESLARAGLTETVDSVLRNIKEVTEEAERMSSAPVPGSLSKEGARFSPKQQDIVFDEARYEDLLRDLTTSIDTLYDLSDSRRALARGEHPSFSSTSEPKAQDGRHRIPRKGISRKPSYASTATTLINPTFSRPSLSPYAGLPARIDVSALRLPEEGPPPYEAVGVPSTTRMVAHLMRQKVPESVKNALGSDAAEVPVLVEYAAFDPTYLDTGVPPPLQRLEVLASIFQPMRTDSQINISLLGFFEDPGQPRIGLVYDLPYSIQNRLNGEGATPISPLSLLKMVQKSNKPQANNDPPVPALEDRFRTALRLTEQLHALHANEITHGNVNSSSVIFTTAVDDTPSARQKHLRTPLWAAFDLFAKCNIEGVTRASSLNIYRHPGDISAMARDSRSDMKFDLYGLGLVLLEIGLWTPIADLYKPKYTVQDFKLRIEKLWIPRLSAKCGSAYMHATEACLRFSDENDTAKLNVEAIYGVLLQYLRRCCLLDDVGTMTELIPASEYQLETLTPVLSNDFQIPAQKHPQLEPRYVSRHPSETTMLTRESTMQSMVAPSLDQRSASAFPATPSVQSHDVVHQVPTPMTDESHLPSQQASSDIKGGSTQQTRPAINLSWKDFKRRITLIQRRWRENRATKLKRELKANSEKLSQVRQNAEGISEQRQKRKRREYPMLELPQYIIDDWHNRTCFELQLLVQKALKGSSESSSIALTAYGETLETARPTFLVCCSSTAKVKHTLKRHFKFDADIYDVRVKKDEIRRCRRSRKDRARMDAERSMAPLRDPHVEKAANPDYQERPLCGASIGAYRDDEHLPPVSFGGIVLIDGRPYGMSVHHMLEPDDDAASEHAQQIEAGADEDDVEDDDDDDDSSSIGSSDDDSILSSDEDDDTVRPPSLHPSDDGPGMVDDTFGDCPGITPGDVEEITITQPALDDAIDLDLHVDEDEDDSDSGVDEDHLLSYKLGQVHASSGLRRTSQSHEGGFKSISQSLPQEIDWALFELEPPRMHAYNIIKGGKRFCPVGGNYIGDTFPVAVKNSSELACAKVHCLGRTSGLGSGIISSTMELVKIHGRSTFSASWTVHGNFGIGGDSGAWVICNDDGRVCGHVLASRRGKTYICPMDLLLQDIRNTLGATDVTLPMNTSTSFTRTSSRRTDVAEAMSKMRLRDQDVSGGVPLPVGPLPQGPHKSGGNRIRRQVSPV